MITARNAGALASEKTGVITVRVMGAASVITVRCGLNANVGRGSDEV